ncbi:MAG TPA: hypothetical protein VHG71_13575 [Verrucomicrobiae bacterium]|nr:hypothetical protein [Verrucomicrobiae bacterium]
MNSKSVLPLVIVCLATNCLFADEITTLDGQKYEDVKDVSLKPNGLFFVTGEGDSMKGVTVPYTNLTDAVKEKYHYDPYNMGFALARQNQTVYLSKNLAFSLDQLDAAKKKAQAEKKMIGFIMEWDSMLIPSRPMGQGSNNGLAHFYDVFHDHLVLVFVRHENELDKVPDAVKQGFQGPEEGGYAPNMAVVTPDCSQFICEIPFGGKDSTGPIREQIFRQKIAVIKNFEKTLEQSK